MKKTKKESSAQREASEKETKMPLAANKMVDDGIFLYYQQKHRKFLYSEILWIEASGSYCNLYLTEHRQIVFVYTLYQLYDKLPKDRFVRIHRSYIVNIYAVTAFIHKMIYISEKMFVISTPYLKNVMSYFNCIDNRKLLAKQDGQADK